MQEAQTSPTQQTQFMKTTLQVQSKTLLLESGLQLLQLLHLILLVKVGTLLQGLQSRYTELQKVQGVRVSVE